MQRWVLEVAQREATPPGRPSRMAGSRKGDAGRDGRGSVAEVTRQRSRECSCGKTLDLDALGERGRQAIPADETACDCVTLTKRFATNGHASDCPGRPYTLALYNCPRCSTTIAEEVSP